MSFFDPNVIAKEQVQAAIAMAPAPPVPVVADVGAPQRKKAKPLLKWLQPVRQYLQWKVAA